MALWTADSIGPCGHADSILSTADGFCPVGGHGSASPGGFSARQILEYRRRKEREKEVSRALARKRAETIATLERKKQTSIRDHAQHMQEAERILAMVRVSEGNKRTELQKDQRKSEELARRAEARRLALERAQEAERVQAEEEARQARVKIETEEAKEALDFFVSTWDTWFPRTKH